MATKKLKHIGHNKCLIFIIQVFNLKAVIDNIYETGTMVRYLNYYNQCNLPWMKAQQPQFMIQMYEPNSLQILMPTAEE